RSFSQKAGEVPEKVGRESLRIISQQISLHLDSFADLYLPNSETATLVGQLVSGWQDPQLYDHLKEQISENSGGASGTDLMAFVDGKAEELAATLPKELQSDFKKLGEQFAEAFKTQKDHG